MDAEALLYGVLRSVHHTWVFVIVQSPTRGRKEKKRIEATASHLQLYPKLSE